VRRENIIAHHYREADDQIVRGPSQRSMQGVVNILAGIGQILRAPRPDGISSSPT